MKKSLFLLFALLIWIPMQVHAETLHRGNGAEVDSLNIHQAQGLNSHNVIRDMYEGLMTLDIKGEPVLGVAESYKNDGLVWTFKLKKEAKWSDGNPVRAEDFIRAWHQALKPEEAAPYSFLFSTIKNGQKIIDGIESVESLSVRALDERSLQIELEKQDIDFLEKLTSPIFYPLPNEKSLDYKVSNGVYQLEKRVLQEKLILKKNPYHYDQANAFYDEVVYWVTENQASELKRFRAKELDITESIPDNQITWLKQNHPDELRIFPYLGSFFLGLNLNDKYLKNLDLRKALYYAIDRDILVSKVLKSGQKPAYSIVPNELLTTKDDVFSRKKQIELAKKHFNKAGINPKTLKLQILYNSSQNQKKVALAVAAMWRQTLGIKSELRNQEWKVFTQTRKSNNKQIFRSGWIADYSSPFSFLELFESSSRFNFYAYENNKYDKLIFEAKNNQQNYQELLSRAQSLLINDLPVIPLYYYVSRHMVSKTLKGFEDNVSDRHLSRYIHSERRGET